MLKNMKLSTKIILYVVLFVIVAVTLLPLLYTLSASFKTNSEIMQGGTNLIPHHATVENYAKVWNMDTGGGKGVSKYNFATYTVNSLKIALLTVAGTLLFTSMSAYCFQRGRFPGQKTLYWLFMGTMFIGAGTVTMFPMLMITSKLNLNNLVGVSIVQIATAGATNLFLTMGYLKTISKELDDAARIDGCSFFGTYWRVILPLSKPILATVALMSFRSSWNDYLLPMLMTAGKKAITPLVVAIVQLKSSGGAGTSQYNLMMAGTMFALLPMLILYLVLNRYFVAGMTQGAVKG